MVLFVSTGGGATATADRTGTKYSEVSYCVRGAGAHSEESDDAEDIAAALESLSEPGDSILYDDVRKELGLE